MLLRFGAKNYLSLRGRQEISFIASALKDREGGLRSLPKGSELAMPVVLLYGANASGKTNTIAALRRMQRDVVHSFRSARPDGGVRRTPFALDPECAETTSAFDADFVADGVRYHYGYECDDKAFTSEWLYSYPEGTRRLLFERTSPADISFGSTVRGQKKALSSLMRPNSLFMSVAVQNNFTEFLPVFKFFESLIFGESLSVDSFGASRAYRDNEIDPRTISFLREINTGVVGYRRKALEEPEGYSAFTTDLQAALRKFVGSESDIPNFDDPRDKSKIELAHRSGSGQDVYLDLQMESAGTRRLLVLLRNVFHALESGGLLIVDELDASLHTQAAEAIVALFVDNATNPNGAQLFTTTHDTNLMASKLLRRDEIWFAEKDESGSTNVYPLTDIYTRVGDNIERGYLQGRFGAIPFAGPSSVLVGRL